MTDELLKLYAERKTAEGHAFPAGNEWMREFEDAFEFNETEDQAQAIADVKRDMESTQPMDRLLCGDVGYGKTEVAMRAAFKAISDNKQVAVLAPTTVLAFQHYETFKQRFAAFPVTIEMISRFRNAEAAKRNSAENRSRQNRHPDRHAPHSFERHQVLRPRPAHRRRRAALRRPPQRTHQADAQAGRRAHHVGHAHSAHPAHVAGRPARHERDRNSAQRPHGDSDRRRELGRKADPIRHRAGTRTRRPGLFRPQPRRDHLGNRRQAAGAGAEGAHHRRPRANVGRRTRKSDAEIHASRSRHSGRNHDHRKRPRHPALQHDSDQSRRPPRTLRALPASRPRGPLQPPRLRLSAACRRRSN